MMPTGIDTAVIYLRKGASTGSGNRHQPYQAAPGDIGEVEMLVQVLLCCRTADINKGDYDKQTALHLAAGKVTLTLSFLCEAGAEVNVEDRWLRRPLMMPAWKSRTVRLDIESFEQPRARRVAIK
jgi:ankyrin repeat protein